MIEAGLGSGYLRLRNGHLAILYLKVCQIAGIDLFDTAQQYGNGNGERILRDILKSDSRVITKIGLNSHISTRIPEQIRWGQIFSAENLSDIFEHSLSRLNTGNCFGLLLHCYSSEYDFRDHIEVLKRIKEQGKVDKVGFSIDSITDIPTDYSWADIVQIPVHLIHHMNVNSGQILMVNGIFRNRIGLETLESYVRKNPTTHVIALMGSKNLFRVIASMRKISALQY